MSLKFLCRPIIPPDQYFNNPNIVAIPKPEKIFIAVSTPSSMSLTPFSRSYKPIKSYK
jgi:hypothetical protein